MSAEINAYELLILFCVFQVKHYLADFVFQTRYMLQKDAHDLSYLKPLLLHSFTHAILTTTIVAFADYRLWWIGAIDLVLHALVDRLKAAPKLLGRFNDPLKASYWRVFGFDQMIHQLTHIGLAWFILFLKQN